MSTPSIFTREYRDKAAIEDLASAWAHLFKKRIDKNPTDPKTPLIERAHSITTQILKVLNEPHAHLIIGFNERIPCSILIADDEGEYLKIRFLVTNVLNPDAKGSGSFLISDLITRFGKSKILKLVPERSLKYWKKLNFRPNPLDATTLIFKNETSTPKKPHGRVRLKH
jgi:hypothetical protein